MGVSVDVHSYDYEELVEEIQKYLKTDNKILIEKILKTGGNIVGDRYIIVDNELWEDSNPVTIISSVFNELFDIDDFLSEIFYSIRDKANRKELINACDDVDTIIENLEDYL